VLLSVSAQAQTALNNVYDFCDDGIKSSNCFASIADDDALIVAGHTQSQGFSNLRCYIAALDYNGNVKSRRNLYGPGNVNLLIGGFAERVAQPLAKIGPDKYVLVGNQWDNTANTRIPVYQPFLFFFNKNCDSLGMVKYTDTIVSREPYSVIWDGNNIVVAGLESSSKIHWDPTQSEYRWDSCHIWIAKYDQQGGQVWSKRIVINKNQYSMKYLGFPSAFRIVASSDGQSYVVTGAAYNKDKLDFDGFITKVDLNGEVIWTKFLPKEHAAGGYFDITSLKNGGYGFCASFAEKPLTIFNPHDTHVYYGKLDENGDTLWTKHFRKDTLGSDGYNIAETENNDLIIHYKYYYHNRRSAAIRTTPGGNIKWHRTYHYRDTPAYDNMMACLSYTPTKQVFLGGDFIAQSAIPGFNDSVGLYSWFVLTDTFGCIEPGCQVGDTVWWLTDVNEVAARPVEISMYPNPATNSLHIVLPLGETGVQAQLLDITGRVLMVKDLQAGKNMLDVAHLLPGNYILKLYKDGITMTTNRVTKQ
jgi:hypothetical protein